MAPPTTRPLCRLLLSAAVVGSAGASEVPGSLGAAHPALPELPDQFETWVTSNIVNKNYSVVVHEIFDAPNNRALISRWHGDDTEHGLSRTLYLFDIGEYFHVNSTSCHGDQLVNIRFGPFSHGNRMPSSKELFNFAREGQTEVYVGRDVVQGIPCNHWESTLSMGPRSSMSLHYYFSVPEWSSPESNATQIPVLLYLTGHYPSFHSPEEMHSFEHYYSFNHFRVGPISTWSQNQFYISSAIPCVGNISTQPEWSKMPEHIDFCEENCSDFPGHGGVYFGFVVLGAACQSVVLMIISFCCGRKYGERLINEMPVTNVAAAGQKPATEMSAAADRERRMV